MISGLCEYSKTRKNEYEEKQIEETPFPIKSWLDWFIVGDVYSVGFGWDFSEIDLWWAAERKGRENAQTGVLQCFFFDTDDKVQAKTTLLRAMQANVTVVEKGHSYREGYERIIHNIETELSDVSR